MNTISLPSNGSMLAFLAIVGFTVFVFCFAHLKAHPESSGKRLPKIIGFAVAWLAVTGLIALSGWAEPAQAALIQAVSFLSIIVIITIAAFSAYGKRVAFAMPVAYLVGLQVFRLPLELILHQWWVDGFLPIQMTFKGDNFDIITGILAVPVAALAWRFPKMTWPLWAFNAIGLYLLVKIILIVNLSNPTPLRAAFGGYPEGNEVWVGAFFPQVWLATVVVSVAIFFHFVLFHNLLALRKNAHVQQT